MQQDERERLTGAELSELFGRLFPHGFAGADILAELAPDGWEESALLTCFHPSVERIFEERLTMHRNVEEFRRMRTAKRGLMDAPYAFRPEPTLETVRSEYVPQPVRRDEELTELVGCCVWDIFSDSNDVTMQDGRVADIGSFRGASAFLDEYLSAEPGIWREGDHMRFYLGSIWLRGRADLTPVYALIFRRLKAIGADWVYSLPQMYLAEIGAHGEHEERQTTYSVSEAAVDELEARKKRAEIVRFRAELDELNARSREEALDQPPPATLRAYRAAYGRDPHGWPPA